MIILGFLFYLFQMMMTLMMEMWMLPLG